METPESIKISKILIQLQCLQDQVVDTHNALADVQAGLVALEQKLKAKEKPAKYRTDPEFLNKLMAGLPQAGWDPVEEFDRAKFPEPPVPAKPTVEEKASTNGHAPQDFTRIPTKALLYRMGG